MVPTSSHAHFGLLESDLGVEMADEEDVLDSWEDADTEELERRMDARQKQLDTVEQAVVVKNARKEDNSREVDSSAALEAQTQLPLRIQDSDRTEYVAPIKILKRQSDASSSASFPSTGVGSTSSPATTTATGRQVKTLAEREAEYASARARILGTNYRPEETASDQLPPSASVVVSSREGRTAAATDSVKRQPKGPNGSVGFQKNGLGT